MIEVAERTYRYDFPSIDTYTLGFSTGESTTQICDSGASDTITEDAIINVVETDINVNGNVNITGDLVVGTTNIIDEIGTKQDTITTDTDLTSNTLTTTGNANIGGTLSVSGS